MLKQWKTLSSKDLLKNPWWTYKIDEYEIPGGIKGEYHYVHTLGSSMIVPVTDQGKIILVNQYRYLCRKDSIELPCGGVKEGKTYEEMARLELEEETGYGAKYLKYVAEFNPFNGATSEMCHVFIARQLYETETKPDITEEFEILHLAPKEIDSMIESNKIWDGMTIAAWRLVRNKL